MVDLARAIGFLDGTDRPVEAALARWIAGEGSSEEVTAALARYRNADGGFGQGLEPDIGAPSSNPFAARLAMQVLLATGATGEEPILSDLAGWLEANQDEDGCWRLPPDAKDHPLAPWFAGWTFPSLNPALCLAGHATRLGIGSERLHGRVRQLFGRMASLDEIPSAEFYALLPYVEYVPWVEVPERDRYLEALAAAIERGATSGAYEDAGHLFEHVGPAGGPIAQQMPGELIAAQLDRLAAEQAEDGGWPSPYAAHWRPWTTAGALATLRGFGRF
jgi:hypothetical protein